MENIFAQSFAAVSKPGSAAKHFELRICTWTPAEKARVRAELDACAALPTEVPIEVLVDTCDGNVTFGVNASSGRLPAGK